MSKKGASSIRQQVFRLLLILSSGVVGGLALVLFMIARYGPTGQYQLDNALIAPAMVDQLSYSKPGDKKGKPVSLAFKEIIFRRPNEKEGNVPLTVDVERYGRLYYLLAGQKSLKEAPPGIERLFAPPAASLDILASSSQNGNQEIVETFQAIQFSPNYFRLLLREEGKNERWIYFSFPGILEKATLIILTPNQ